MKRAILTVGLGFGDEGKGATVDYLAREHGADLVVRYCGGSQAGHNVQLPDGRRHTFAQFGAGSLVKGPAPPKTYLGPQVVVDPLALRREARHLEELGVKGPTDLLTVHPRCLITTVWHRALNQLRELARGAARHGSCGQGIGEARRYWLAHGESAVFAEDLFDEGALSDKLELLRQRALLELQGFVDRIDPDHLSELDLWGLDTEAVAADLSEPARQGLVVSAEAPNFHTAIFEGAQGVLLDEYRGFHPHTTWSTVTTHHAWGLVRQLGVEAVAVLGVTRAYATRHGEGPLPTHSPELTARLRDEGNPWNRWQGGLRCGWLDLPLLRYAAAVTGPLDGIVVNHLDQMTGAECWIAEDYAGAAPTPAPAPSLSWQGRLTEELREARPALARTTPDGIVRRLEEIAPVVLTGHGPTHRERTFRGLNFRHRRASPGSEDCPVDGHG
jgi:adenylosuccinate synthase